uniref:PHD-type domain-containing protein n=1 Tax=Anopheles dirus TaxID=7168 RepID=A0A182NDR5_9DIPT
MESTRKENEQPCMLCDNITTEKMVKCDACDDFFHLGCVKVDETVYEREFLCRVCQPKPMERRASSSAGANQPEHNSTKEISRVFNEMKARMDKLGWNSGNSTEEKCFKCQAASKGVMVKCAQCERKLHVTCIGEGVTTIGTGWKCSECMMPSSSNQSCTLEAIMHRLMAIERKMEAKHHETEARRTSGFLYPSSVANENTHFTNEGELTRSQASARHVVSGKLPTFFGDPDEWDMFYAAYEESTRLCGYSDGENMQRLREALKGQALKAVKRRLYYGENLPEVIETLKTMYGRPELVISTLLDKIRRTPVPKMERLETLVDYGLEVEEICATVRSSGVERTYDGPILEELVERLPAVLRLNWGMHCDTLSSVTLAQFAQWMTKVKKGALRVSPRSTLREEKRIVKHVNTHATNQSNAQPRRTSTATDHNKPDASYVVLKSCACSDNCRRLVECDEFLRMNAENRWKYVTENHLCHGCLRRHQRQCRLQHPCGKTGCNKQHHTLLHYLTTERSGKYEISTSHSAEPHRDVLLRYVPVTIRAQGRQVNVIALLDEGSSVSLMEHALTKELGISGKSKPLCLSWTGGQLRDEAESIEVSVNISGIRGQDRQYEVPAIRTVRKLGLPTQSVDMNRLAAKYQHLSSLPIPSFDSTAPRILLGMDNYHLTRPLKTVEGTIDEPVATKTRLGWVISGRCDSDGRSSMRGETISSHRVQLCECQDMEVRIDNAFKGSFVLDEPRGAFGEAIMSKEEERASELLRTSTQLVDGRYTTGLLWRYDGTILPNNRKLAIRRMECLERKLNRDAQLRCVMNNKVKEYLEKGYIRLLTTEEKRLNHPRACVTDAVQLAKDVKFIHSEGGFPLHNWMSNSAEVLQAVEGTAQPEKDLTLEPRSTPNKVLGMWWDSRSDTFCFKTPTSLHSFLEGNAVPTKRQLLSLLMSIYDPLGLIAGFCSSLK